jgi:hypothetical protein
MALGLPKRSLGRAFHWQPVRNTYTMPSNICRIGIAGRPAPGRRMRSSCRTTTRWSGGSNGSTRRQNSSVTTHDATRFANSTLQHRLLCHKETVLYLIYGQVLIEIGKSKTYEREQLGIRQV